MKKRVIALLILSLIILLLTIANIWSIIKIKEFSENFQTQAEIELKRTSLIVIYQSVLENVVREVDQLKQNQLPEPKMDFGLPLAL